jgi:hypothetical protein
MTYGLGEMQETEKMCGDVTSPHIRTGMAYFLGAAALAVTRTLAACLVAPSWYFTET